MKTKNLMLVLCWSSLVLIGSVAAPTLGWSEEGPAPLIDENQATQFVAYYFHTNVRCATCKKLQAYSQEAVLEGFPEEITNKSLVFKVVNTDEDENSHFIKDFGLVTKSLVLVESNEGQVKRFENLNLIWQKVRDKEAFLTYVRDEAGRFFQR